MRKELTLEAVRADPYGFTYKEYAEVMGEAEASRAFASLYRRKVAPASQTLTVKTVYRGGDTDKYVFELPDGKCIETVCIKRRDGATVCVSTQVGCPVRCMFCESGKNGFVRNLTPSEIVQQVVLLGRKITRIVYMGMGEPLLNYDNVIQSIHILRDRNGLNFPTDGITLSTTGPLDRLKRLREEHLKIQFTLSLHISREFGSGGRELGKRLADALGVPCYDQQIIDMIAQKKNLDKNYIAHVSEKDVRVLYPSTIGKHIIAPNYIGH